MVSRKQYLARKRGLKFFVLGMYCIFVFLMEYSLRICLYGAFVAWLCWSILQFQFASVYVYYPFIFGFFRTLFIFLSGECENTEVVTLAKGYGESVANVLSSCALFCL